MFSFPRLLPLASASSSHPWIYAAETPLSQIQNGHQQDMWRVQPHSQQSLLEDPYDKDAPVLHVTSRGSGCE